MNRRERASGGSRALASVLVMLVLLVGNVGRVRAGGQADSQLEPDAPRLEVAQATPVDDPSGYAIRIAGWWNGPDESTFAGAEQITRWRAAEAHHDVTLEWVTIANPQTLNELLIASVLAGDPFADLIHIQESAAVPALAESNMILPLDDYFDFSNPKWPGVTVYRDRVFAYVPLDLGGGDGVWYNVSLLEREGLPDLYELQESGEWTWDAYLEIAQTTTQDTDSDGEIDQWGIAVGYEIEYPLIWSNGGRVVRYLDDGSETPFAFSLGEPQAVEALEFIQRIHESGVSTTGEDAFVGGRAAMYGGALFQGSSLAARMTDEYGWVYYPRGPRADEYSSVGGSAVVIVFPSNLRYPPDRLATIAEQIIPFETMDQIQMEFLEGQLQRRVDIETALEMSSRSTGKEWRDHFPGVLRPMGRIFHEIRTGGSPQTAVEQYAPQGQSAVDAMFN